MEHVAPVVDHEAKAPFPGKERHSMPPFIRIDAPFTQAGNPSFAHFLLDELRLDPEAPGDNRYINLNGATFKLNYWHHRYHQPKCCDHEFSSPYTFVLTPFVSEVLNIDPVPRHDAVGNVTMMAIQPQKDATSRGRPNRHAR
jgi:hypothetical protein